MTSQPQKQTIAIQILPVISRSKGNQAMKFAHLIECNMKKKFLEGSYTKFGGQTLPRFLSEN